MYLQVTDSIRLNIKRFLKKDRVLNKSKNDKIVLTAIK